MKERERREKSERITLGFRLGFQFAPSFLLEQGIAGAFPSVFVESRSPFFFGLEKLTERNSLVDDVDEKKAEKSQGQDSDPDTPRDDGFEEVLRWFRNDVVENNGQEENSQDSHRSEGNQHRSEVPQDRELHVLEAALSVQLVRTVVEYFMRASKGAAWKLILTI